MANFRNLLIAVAIRLLCTPSSLAQTLTSTPTCNEPCQPPATTSIDNITWDGYSCSTPAPTATTTCTDDILTITTKAIYLVNCSNEFTTVPYTRCPTSVDRRVTHCPVITPGTAIECPNATDTVTVTSTATMPNQCWPTQATYTIKSPPTGTDRLPVCTPPVAQKYGQCGGIGYWGPTVCVEGSTCVAIGPHYSMCM